MGSRQQTNGRHPCTFVPPVCWEHELTLFTRLAHCVRIRVVRQVPAAPAIFSRPGTKHSPDLQEQDSSAPSNGTGRIALIETMFSGGRGAGQGVADVVVTERQPMETLTTVLL